jgi:hypothetical protein
MCPSVSKPPALKWYGVAIDGKGFYAMDNIAPLPRIQPENLTYVLVDDLRASVEVIEDGLKKLVCEDWNWQVECLSETDFSVVFPTPSVSSYARMPQIWRFRAARYGSSCLIRFATLQLLLRCSRKCGLMCMAYLHVSLKQSASRQHWKW